MYFFYEPKEQIIQGEYRTKLEFGAHIHGHLELVYMLQGEAEASVDFKSYIITKGDVFWIFPNQVHMYHQEKEGTSIILIFPPQFCPDFLRLFESRVPLSPVIPGVGQDPEITGLLERIILLVTASEPKVPYGDSLIRGNFLALSSLLLARVELVGQQASDSSTIKDVLKYCSMNFDAEISLESLAAELKLSKFYISRLFHQKLHIGFSDYINMLRVDEACRLLTTDNLSITDIAYQTGFTSIRSFNRVFRNRMGVTPGAYRAIYGLRAGSREHEGSKS